MNTVGASATRVLFFMACVACTGDISNDRAASGDGDSASGGRAGQDDSPGTGGQDGQPGDCDRLSQPASPLVRLSNQQYANTLRDLFKKMALPALSLPREVALSGFVNNAKAQSPSQDLIESYSQTAAVISKAAASSRALTECTVKVPADEAKCGSSFLVDFGRRAFRRPLQDVEIADYQALLTKWSGLYGFADALTMVAESMLQSPDFLYRIERGVMGSDGKRTLTSAEKAARLSYFLTNSMPDAELAAAVDKDELADEVKLKVQAQRLLALPSARAMVADFNSQWLQLGKLDRLEKDKAIFKSFNDDVATSLRQGTLAYVDKMFWEGDGSLKQMLTDTHAMVDKNLAGIYGVQPPQGEGMSLVPVDGSRAGILTSAGLLAAFSHASSSAPVQRGVLVLNRILCQSPPPPPAGVDTSLPPLGANARMTTRQQIELTHNKPSCLGCHTAIDAVGFAYENFDAIGAYRTTDNGLPVDAKVKLAGLSIDGEVTGAVELAKKLVADPEVEACVASQWFQYARGLSQDDFEQCAIQDITASFRKSQLSMKELLVAIAVSDSFTALPAIE